MSEWDVEAFVEDLPIDKTCNQIRGQIRTFLESGGMKIGEFQKPSV
jgi:hypothetical protein